MQRTLLSLAVISSEHFCFANLMSLRREYSRIGYSTWPALEHTPSMWNTTDHYVVLFRTQIKHLLGTFFHLSILLGTSDLERRVSAENAVHMSTAPPVTHTLCHPPSTKPAKLHSDFCGIIITSIWDTFSTFWSETPFFPASPSSKLFQACIFHFHISVGHPSHNIYLWGLEA